MESKIIDNAFSYNIDVSHRLNEVCYPLEKNLGITLVGYRRFYFTGKLLCLFHLKDWMNYSFQNQCWHSVSFDNRIKYLPYNNTIYYLWPEAPPADDKVYCVLHDYGIWNGVVIYKKFVDCMEAYAFASLKKNNKSVRNFYILEKDLFERFIIYFKDKIFPLVTPVEKQILIPYERDFPSYFAKGKQAENYLAETDVKNFYFRISGKDVRLTEKQAACLFLFTQHKKMKEVGKILDLSGKTVESYLRIIAKKLGCNTKSQLIQYYKTLR
ncbi:MAG: transcription regulator [uncultured bacterium]|nr:MAG: transcription regulator [uncultured bacterium]